MINHRALPIPPDDFDRAMSEAWDAVDRGLIAPYEVPEMIRRTLISDGYDVDVRVSITAVPRVVH